VRVCSRIRVMLSLRSGLCFPAECCLSLALLMFNTSASPKSIPVYFRTMRLKPSQRALLVHVDLCSLWSYADLPAISLASLCVLFVLRTSECRYSFQLVLSSLSNQYPCTLPLYRCSRAHLLRYSVFRRCLSYYLSLRFTFSGR